MNREMRRQFFLQVVGTSQSRSNLIAVTETLQVLGYTTRCTEAPCLMEEDIIAHPPHILIFVYDSCFFENMGASTQTNSVHQWLKGLKERLPETWFLGVFDFENLTLGSLAQQLGNVEYILLTANWLTDVAVSVQRACNNFLLQYQLEQFDESPPQKKSPPPASPSRSTPPSQEADTATLKAIDSVKQQFTIGQTLDAITGLLNELDTKNLRSHFVRTLCDFLKIEKIIYLKYLEAHQSVMICEAVGVAGAPQGLGCSVSGIPEIVKPDSPIALPAEVHELLKKVLGHDFIALPIVVETSLDGFIAYEAAVDACRTDLIEKMGVLLAGFLARNAARVRLHASEILDPVVPNLFNKRYFEQILIKEISRARRIFKPVSLMILSIDRFNEIAEAEGNRRAHLVLKSFAKLVKRMSRVYDVVARIGTTEVAVLLPHVGIKNAAIKAERLRRLIENIDLLGRPFMSKSKAQALHKVTVSIGVSEYPSVASDDESLVKTADGALFYVQRSSFNQVCMAAPPADFKPDFQTSTQKKSDQIPSIFSGLLPQNTIEILDSQIETG